MLALVAVFALSAVAAASASAALPEFAGTYPQKFKGTIGKSSFLWNGVEFKSKKGTISGEITSATKVADVVIKLTEGGGAGDCVNSEKGTVLVTNELVGRIGYISKTSKDVGLLLEPKSGSVANCESGTYGSEELTGSIIGGHLGPVNKATGSFSLSIEREGSGSTAKQKFEKFEGEEVLHKIEDLFGTEKRSNGSLGITMEEMTLELPKAIELKA